MDNPGMKKVSRGSNSCNDFPSVITTHDGRSAEVLMVLSRVASSELCVCGGEQFIYWLRANPELAQGIADGFADAVRQTILDHARRGLR
ncbi:MAG: hypothetical protein ACRD04_06015 [Terriglobales bacterium]